MQNPTMATAPKRGIPLDSKLFTKAIAKARSVRPTVMHVGAHYAVLMSDQRTWAHVSFVLYDRLYASCNCRAHTIGDRGKPVPCYHIAAAALSREATALFAAQPAALPKPASTGHTHACPYCCDVYPCHCKNPEIDDVVCDACGSRSVDWAASYGDDKSYWL